MNENKEETRSMVAISLYRGNLHRVPDVPRRWPMPAPKITLKDFKSLLARRSKALSRLQNPNSTPLPNGSQPEPPPTVTVNHGEGPSITVAREDGDRNETPLVAVSSAKKPLAGSDSEKPQLDSKIDEASEKKTSDGVAAPEEEQTEPVAENEDLLNEKKKRKKEIEEKLHGLNDNKHNLVLVLKQILNAEEELKRRNSMQVVAMRGPSVPLQGDGTNDTGSMIRHMPPRLGSEGNLVAADVDGGGEGDDFANHTMHSRHVLRTSSMSPSSESTLRRTPSISIQQNVISHPSRANMGAAGSPSRFALSGHQGNPMNLPSVSVSGTSYIASSPSPAASGGTSVFRDARQPSPWK
ncbi:hypothetical protein AAZX31_06G179600 [Glycine max]|uniref:Uncharacterized protein n=2 Tax=Glycine subgen. Soja TaxID=1462606 RepID=I1KCM6_SOYBN|nr:uncharacterized protein LOC100794844 [Glycine max]XP_028237184.1 uncharacterized protein LOC114416499 [Glycine soja]KAG5046304.1 hypothetical protein JHK86_015710 [Glycine max]KAG5148801.1 hypothetical protein JHK82_015682 [Glycine max]KAH1126609.1 hypothetical protein GYH30_015558 [Glycine max]KAH1246305.1 hypothetical protein GmHk_06G016414 [Glycine max]KRH54480.1 hypothetical protein GLYMA_06G188300v4 [Glycine max]|eukprot:XP_003528169.2 uncharacterized protein LOC100794844 [Glycine max]